MTTKLLLIERVLRVPGLGLLVLPAGPAPDWLLAPALHTPLSVRRHQSSAPPGPPLLASIEEIAAEDQPLTRALLLPAERADFCAPGTQLALVTADPDELLLLL